MTSQPNLAALLPVHVQRRDAETGAALSALLAVVGEQLGLTEDAVAQLYEDWFIETCAPWAVNYIGGLVGYRIAGGYTAALAAGDESARLLAARLAPRRDVADTVSARRRKGTLSVLEDLARSVADWPARAVEFRRTLGITQPVRLYGDAAAIVRRAGRTPGRLIDVRDGAALDLLGTPFDESTHLAEAPRISAPGRRTGRHNPQAVGVFVWRRTAQPVTRAPANCIDSARNLYTFSVLGNDTGLITNPVPEPVRTHLAGAENLPVAISRRAARDRLPEFYGPGRSFTIWAGARNAPPTPVPLSAIVVADLSGWRYRPGPNQVVVDPVLGRIAFGRRALPRRGVWVSYHHAFPDDLGGGEYPRLPVTPQAVPTYRVGDGADFERINQAYERWKADQPAEAIIEITDNGAYQEQLEFEVGEGQRLTLRAAEGKRPTLRLLNWYSNRPDALQLRGVGKGARMVLDGLLITGRGVSVAGPLAEVDIRHCTLVPGWSLESHCAPTHPAEPSLVLEETRACLNITRSILGTIVVVADEVHTDPLDIRITDSILDATATDREALTGPEGRLAHAVLNVERCTVIGRICTHAIRLAENCILDGKVRVARRAVGCIRFCYLPAGSRTPRRFHCEPDTALRGAGDADERRLILNRVRPRFTARGYGMAGYLQLAQSCPDEIRRGAEDRSEMGVYHHLFQPQREDDLRRRLDEFTPAGAAAGLVFVD
ncbi:hypothetical protein [Mangrovihabitans endophyticus]|uniref:Uncharacterized protein n=1 Tax=Mangrovihabitans endophyticus TaxID=1751298 RepID=A0A8J3BSV7_9ACTN|nr:hypothetical protein [Mangrovihabitans endophyticus]GGK74612.1 hypothetical protein GCM10012284_05690 [Mangrovihabitans endophyticus]